jgi:uncharacterized membrane protein
MAKDDFKISPFLIWGVIILNLCIISYAALIKLSHISHRFHGLILIGLTSMFFVQIIIIFDIYNNKITNKFFWILSMFIFPGIAPIIYLIRREKISVR